MASYSDFDTNQLYRLLGSRIRDVRRAAGLTQAELASAMSLSRTSVTNIEKGRQHLLIHSLFDIARAVGGTPEELLSGLLPTAPSEVRERIPGDVRGKDRQWMESLMSTISAKD